MSQLGSDLEQNYQTFLKQAKQNGKIWGLEADDGWVVCDSNEYDDTDVMPFWSNQQEAAQHCIDEWSGYQVSEIEFDDFVDHWIKGMIEDGVLIGPNWNQELDGLEIDPLELARELLEVRD